MKYQFTSSRLSKEDRELYNKSVIEGLRARQPIDKDKVFNYYTGIGGLHGLKYVDFDSFHEYTEAKKEIEAGQFFTPPPLCEQIMLSLKPTVRDRIADLTCGSGNFYNYVPVESNAYGCEIEPNAYAVAKFLYPEANIVEGDFLHVFFDTRFDMVVGNPPFNLKTPQGLSQFVFMQKAATYLREGRVLCFLAPKTFLEDEYTNRHKRAEISMDFDFVCQAVVPSTWFDVGIDIKLMYWQKTEHSSGNQYRNEYVEFDPEAIYEKFIKPIQEYIKENAARLLLSERNKNQLEKWLKYDNGVTVSPQQQEQIKKCLFEIKTHKHLRKKAYEKAQEQLKQLQTLRRTPDMTWIEWEKIKPDADKLIRWMKKKISNQYRPSEGVKVLKLVKKARSIKLKAYSKALANKEQEVSMLDLVTRPKDYTGNKFKKFVARKRKEYRVQDTPFPLMQRDEKIDAWLRDFELREGLSLFDDEPPIKFNDKQFHDAGLIFQKKYAIVAWQQGSGKSILAMGWMSFFKPRVKYTFLTAPSLAVQLTWKPRLTKYGYNFTIVDCIEDFKKLKPGRIIVMSFDMVRILKDHLQRFIKREACYSIALVVDESDELTNGTSSRTRAMLQCFRKAKYKLLTTGTTTRNNINELYPQLELLYNNSVNFICWSPTMYKTIENSDELDEQLNPYYGKPFPAVRGHTTFRWCHCPQKTSVFGVQKDTQDVYNADPLKALMAKTIITRTFDDVVGKRIYKLKTHHVMQGAEEHRLYAKIIDEFYAIVYNYFNSTGNSRKEAMLRIIRQITLLIQSTSIPHTFVDYEGDEMPNKFYHICGLLKGWSQEKVAIGTVMIEAAQEYFRWVQVQLPDRKIYYIDGKNSFASRKRIIADFQATNNGILISTQQSLKSSVDIETCNKCIIESLQWNIPKMSQYYFRFIRYNSKEDKEVHFVTYASTIEQNILALLMSKEKLNQFVKTGELQERADIMNEYDVDTSILDQIITKEYDDKGKLHLKWGNQKISN